MAMAASARREEMMQDGMDTILRVQRMSAALRGRYSELKQRAPDRATARLLDDLASQHSRHAKEISVLLADHNVDGARAPGMGDAVAGDEHLVPPSLPYGVSMTTDRILSGIVAAETDMRSAYGIAIDSVSPFSPLRSTLERHAIMLATALSRADAVRSLA
jgi:hypothetical protein